MKCVERACPFPALADGYCRGHWSLAHPVDRYAEIETKLALARSLVRQDVLAEAERVKQEAATLAKLEAEKARLTRVFRNWRGGRKAVRFDAKSLAENAARRANYRKRSDAAIAARLERLETVGTWEPVPQQIEMH